MSSSSKGNIGKNIFQRILDRKRCSSQFKCLPNNVIQFFEIARANVIHESAFVKIFARALRASFHLPDRLINRDVFFSRQGLFFVLHSNGPIKLIVYFDLKILFWILCFLNNLIHPCLTLFAYVMYLVSK